MRAPTKNLSPYQLDLQLAYEAGADDRQQGRPLIERNRNRSPEIPAHNQVLWNAYKRGYYDE